jgi:uncharacterized protein YjiS (DUF1127 family)
VLVVTDDARAHQLILRLIYRITTEKDMTRNAQRDSISARATAVIEALVAYGRAWRQYETTMSELSRMSDRELADLRITRSAIPDIAWDPDILNQFQGTCRGDAGRRP